MRSIADVTGFNNAAGLNPRKPYFSATYRNDILRFDTPVVSSGAPASGDIPQSFQALSTSQFLFAGWRTLDTVLKVGTGTFSSTDGSEVSIPSGTTVFTGDSNTHATFCGSWVYASGAWRYYFLRYESNTTAQAATGYSCNSSGTGLTTFSATGLPTTYVQYQNNHYKVRRPSAFIQMEHGDKIAVYTSYEYMSGIAQFVCTMSFYYAPDGSTAYTRMRTVVQYEIDEPEYNSVYGIDAGICRSMDHLSASVFAISSDSGKFFVVANDGTKAIRFTYNNGVEGLAEPIIPIDIDANRLEITDAGGAKSYGKYHQFLPTALSKINGRNYLNGRMTRTYSNGDKRSMAIYLWSTDGINWAVGDVSSFIDASYYKKDIDVRLWNYAFVYPASGPVIYAIGNDCFSWANAREIDSGNSETDFSNVIIEGDIVSNSNSADSVQLMVMKGFDTVDPSVIGGKTITVNLGYYDVSNSAKYVKMGEYFVESEAHVLSSAGRGPNGIKATDAGAWKLTRWSSITDIDRWSSTFVQDELKVLSKLIVKGISSDYITVDNATGTGLYLSNLNDPFVGYTSTRDERDGMFTACVRFTDTGSTAKLSSVGLLMGAEDYTDIYTKGAKDRKGFNALMFPASSSWTGHIKTGPQMRKSNLKRRYDNPATPENESDTDTAFQWIRRYTNLWERETYIADQLSTDSAYNVITAPAATGQSNVIYQGSWVAQHGVDYELVMRRHSGRVQAFARKKGFTESTVAATGYSDYSLIYEYQFDKDDRMDWGPRPFWGLVANTDVFCSLDGWNSREYGDIETTITEASNNIGSSVQEYIDNFPDSKLASYGYLEGVNGVNYVTYNTTTTTQQVWVDREPSSGGGYYENQTTTSTTTNSQALTYDENYLIQVVGVDNLSVGEMVRVFLFEENGVSPDPIGWTIDGSGALVSSFVNFNPGRTNANGRSEFVGIIEKIENSTQINISPPAKKITFSKTWGNGGLFNRNGQNVYYTMYKVGPKSTSAKLSSGSIFSDVLTSVVGVTLPIDIRNGTIKQASVTAGRAAIVNRQNDAIMVRMMDSDGSTHQMYDYSGQTKLGFDWPTNPISNISYPGNSGLVTTREWRLLMKQGRLFPFSSVQFGLPDGLNKSYMIKGDEIVRYVNWGYKSQGSSTVNAVWCIIPAYYTPIFPSVKGATTVQQWSVQSNSAWIEPGDKFNLVPNVSGMRVYINGKGGSYTVDGDVKQYAVSAAASNNGSTASVLTFSPALNSGVDSMDPGTERTKETDKQLKEIAILSGREQLGTTSGLQSYADPLCYYPIGPNITEKPNSFIKVNYTTMNVGLYNSAKDNLKYVCNLAGVADVQFMDTASTVSSVTTLNSNLAHFLLEMTGTFTTSSSIKLEMRSAYTLTIEFQQYSTPIANRAHVALTLKTAVGFSPAANISGGNASERTIAKVVVPVSDIAWAGSHDLRVALRKERLIVEMDRASVWTFDLKTYKFGGSKNDNYDLFTDVAGPLKVTPLNVTLNVNLVELADEVENQIIDMSQSGGDAMQFITRERHIHTRSTQDGGLQFGRFLEGNRTVVNLNKTGNVSLTQDFIKDQIEYNPYGVPGHVLVTGAEYGEHMDPEWIRQNGYMFASNQNRLLNTVEDSILEAKLLMRMAKEDSDNSTLEMIGLPHIQPEDGLIKNYDFPENTVEEEIVSGHSIKFDKATLASQFNIRKKYSLG